MKMGSLATACLVVLLGGSACKVMVLPSDQRPTVGAELLEGMRIVPVEWPDTMVVGEVAQATVALLLANGVPYEPDRLAFHSPAVDIAGLSPTASPTSKLVIAFAPGKVSIAVDAFVGRSRATCNCYDYHVQRVLDVVVVPARQSPTDMRR